MIPLLLNHVAGTYSPQRINDINHQLIQLILVKLKSPVAFAQEATEDVTIWTWRRDSQHDDNDEDNAGWTINIILHIRHHCCSVSVEMNPNLLTLTDLTEFFLNN